MADSLAVYALDVICYWGPSKKAASSSATGSSAGSGSSGGWSSGAWNRHRGRFRRSSRSHLGRQQSGQFGTSSSFQGGTFGGQTFSYRQQQSTRCYECGSQDHFRRDCPLLAQRTTPTPTHLVGQSSARGSNSGAQGSASGNGSSW
uniref:glycine-rich protein 2-like n=1 Tax=Fragaria vesca subsp. vesca TaxID=101020 RepID=UPI0005C82ECB|nr:PREDICTED: glycine-rich protein 2-like [Fragaria vesca subsp. vesca]